ncbi:leucine/isoleucine/valine transporter permease subunit [Variovorax sp. SRS16]|uniref:branched-chain amino acid ABC transporter permease n=1 Tax=Variovorax sp. SRS16 TaxID=282217 RepID=UPI0013183E42|nr:branched-chain amino acid ABC transporter permease [Variovorax sp. SRS16]VTU19038.1 leucine/isoleucine/valine transporter permease subunit [Variovorax sp. SRS16]
MMNFFYTYQSLLDHVLVYALLAMSQYVVLRAGVFSLGTAGFAALGAYACALLITKAGWTPLAAIVAGTLLGAVASGLLAMPLSRLRGVFQAVATLAMVQIVLSATQNWVSVTNGALGVNGIPKVAGTGELLLTVIVVVAVLGAMGRYRIGRAMDVIREDETVAVSLGIPVPHYHRIAFVLSGFLAGLGGALQATSSYAITPGEFGFGMLVTVLAMVVLGGRTSVWGALAGAAILTTLPELFRVFADYRNVVEGILLMLVIVYLPRGVADTLIAMLRDRRLRHRAGGARAGQASVPAITKTVTVNTSIEGSVRP